MVLQDSVHEFQWIFVSHFHANYNLGFFLSLNISWAHDRCSFLILEVLLLVLGQLVYRLSVRLLGVEELVLLLDMITIKVEVLSISFLFQLSHDLWELLIVALWLFQKIVVSRFDLINSQSWHLLRKLLYSEVYRFIKGLSRSNAFRELMILVLFFHRGWLIGWTIS